MKKSSLAEISHAALISSQVEDHTRAGLVHILETSFSALATMDPDLTLDILKQLQEKTKEIKELAESRVKDKQDYVKMTVESLPDTMEFQDESEPDEDEDDSDFNH